MTDAASCDVRLTGAGPEWFAGNALAAGDLDGDGWPDLVVGAMQADLLQSAGGAAFVVWGGTL